MLCIECRRGFTGSFDASLLSLSCGKKYSIRYCSQIKCLIIISIDTRLLSLLGLIVNLHFVTVSISKLFPDVIESNAGPNN